MSSSSSTSSKNPSPPPTPRSSSSRPFVSSVIEPVTPAPANIAPADSASGVISPGAIAAPLTLVPIKLPILPNAPSAPIAVDLASVGNASDVYKSSEFHPPTDSALNTHALATYRRLAASGEVELACRINETPAANAAAAMAANPMHRTNVALRPMESTRNALATLPGRFAHATAMFSAYTFEEDAPPSSSSSLLFSRAKNSGSQSIIPYHPHDSENHTKPIAAALERSGGAHRLRSGASHARVA
mmetsp:Transcript_3512/g.16027  ORF Transcript_3512/g.16027 Transcript_3512/m.16027 type:complete len:245 (-) Transcript_3512:797-1531(-)